MNTRRYKGESRKITSDRMKAAEAFFEAVVTPVGILLGMASKVPFKKPAWWRPLAVRKWRVQRGMVLDAGCKMILEVLAEGYPNMLDEFRNMEMFSENAGYSDWVNSVLGRDHFKKLNEKIGEKAE